MIMFHNEPLFNARHIGECLDIDDVTVRRHIQSMSVNQVVRLTNETINLSAVHDLNIRKMNNAGENFLTESGVFKLCMKSRKPSAEKFQDWVCDEVLPSIRKTGKYSVHQENNESLAKVEFENRMSVASIMEIPKHIALVECVKMVKKDTGINYEPLLLASPIMNNIAIQEEMLEPTDIGKKIGISGKALNTFIESIGWQAKIKKQWVATDTGENHCTKHAWKKGHKSGYNYKWNVSKVLGKYDIS